MKLMDWKLTTSAPLFDPDWFEIQAKWSRAEDIRFQYPSPHLTNQEKMRFKLYKVMDAVVDEYWETYVDNKELNR